MMMTRGRSCLAAFMACATSLFFAAHAYPSYNTEAGHKYAVASQRLADLKKSPKKKKYRSYWIDCIRTFELVEKTYPKSPDAGDACLDRAELYFELYKFSKFSRDLNSSLRTYASCQSSYPQHQKAAEALFHVVDISLAQKKDRPTALKTYEQLAQNYAESPWTAKARTRLGLSSKVKKKEPELRPMPVPRIASPGAAKTAGVVKSIRHWSGGAYTRIVIDQTSAVRFQASELKHPDRLVFDIMNARVDASIDKGPMQVNDGILRQVRASQYAPDTVRVVLDLASLKSYAAFPLHDPERLVIDVTGEGLAATESLPTGSAATGTDQTASAETVTIQQKPEPAPDDKLEQPNHTTAVKRPMEPAQRPAQPDNDGAKLSLSRQMGLKVRTIAIDAGHGGHDPGAIGKSGLKEKTITLDIAKRLSELVKERLGCEGIMTRGKEVFIPLDERPFIAKSKGADLFVSIHVNANRKRKARGIETYIQGLKASDREAMATAARENAMSDKRLSDLDSEIDKILKDLKQDNKLEESLQLAHTVQASLVETMKPAQGHIVNLGVKRAFFYVLINTQMPSILAEVGFISNPEEEKLLKTDSYRQAVAEALFQGVKNYVNERSPQMMGI
jgi:N-acetylmuramoyl-L-alanine amidase